MKSWLQERMTRLVPVNVWTVTALALLVRVVTATWTGLTTDEANGMAIAVTGSWLDMIENLKADGNPPLFYAFMRCYVSVFGYSDLALKLFAVVLSTLVVPAAYFLCRTMLSRELALSVSLMLALCPPVVRYGTMIRGYSLMPLFSLASTWAFARIIARPLSPVWPVCYGVATAALVYTHYWGVFVAVGQALTTLVALARRWIGWSQVRRLAAGALLALILFTPWLPFFYYQSTHIVGPWDQPPRFSTSVMGMIPLILVGSDYSASLADQIGVLFANLLILVAVISPQVMIGQTADDGEPRDGGAERPLYDGRIWKGAAAFSVLSGMIFSFVKPAVRDRYFTPFAPLLIIVYVTGMAKLLERLPGTWKFVVAVLLWLPLWAPRYALLLSQPETGTRAVVEEINRRADRSKDLVVISFQSIAPAVVFYLPEDIRVTTFPDLERSRFNIWSGMNSRLKDPARLKRLYQIMEDTLDRGGKIFLIDWAHNVVPRDPHDNSLVMGLPFIPTDLRRQDQIRTWLDIHAQRSEFNRMAPGRDLSVFLSIYRPRQDNGVPPPQALPALPLMPQVPGLPGAESGG